MVPAAVFVPSNLDRPHARKCCCGKSTLTSTGRPQHQARSISSALRHAPGGSTYHRLLLYRDPCRPTCAQLLNATGQEQRDKATHPSIPPNVCFRAGDAAHKIDGRLVHVRPIVLAPIDGRRVHVCPSVLARRHVLLRRASTPSPPVPECRAGKGEKAKKAKDRAKSSLQSLTRASAGGC